MRKEVGPMWYHFEIVKSQREKLKGRPIECYHFTSFLIGSIPLKEK
jgi:hypothetical protein